MYETRKLFLLSDDPGQGPAVELVIEVANEHLYFEIEVAGHDCAQVKIPLDEAEETLERLVGFVRGEIVRQAHERGE